MEPEPETPSLIEKLDKVPIKEIFKKRFSVDTTNTGEVVTQQELVDHLRALTEKAAAIITLREEMASLNIAPSRFFTIKNKLEPQFARSAGADLLYEMVGQACEDYCDVIKCDILSQANLSLAELEKEFFELTGLRIESPTQTKKPKPIDWNDDDSPF